MLQYPYNVNKPFIHKSSRYVTHTASNINEIPSHAWKRDSRTVAHVHAQQYACTVRTCIVEQDLVLDSTQESEPYSKVETTLVQ